MGDKLTNEDKKFVKELVETGNKTQSAIKAYGYKNENTAGVMALEKLRKPKIQNAIQTLADRIPDDLVIEKHIALLNKTEKKYNSDGDLISEEIDTNAVKAGVDMSYKLKRAYETDENKNINILNTVLVKFLNNKNETDSDGDTN